MSEWPQLARDFGGWGLFIAGVVRIAMAVLRGEIVLGREYTTLKEDNKELRADLKSRDETLAQSAAANEKLTASVEALTGVTTDLRDQIIRSGKGNP